MFCFTICLPSRSKRPPCALGFCLAFSVSPCLSLLSGSIYWTPITIRQGASLQHCKNKDVLATIPSPQVHNVFARENLSLMGKLAAEGWPRSATWAMWISQAVHSPGAGLVHRQLGWKLSVAPRRRQSLGARNPHFTSSCSWKIAITGESQGC